MYPDPPLPIAGERFVQSGREQLYVRDIGRGMPIIVLHGGPDFDHEYLLPDVDRLADRFHLIFYDQRGRGRSFRGHQPDVTMDSEVNDLDRVREEFACESIAVLGHSWGGLLAMEYAIRHPQRVSHLILMNTAPASRVDALYEQTWERDDYDLIPALQRLEIPTLLIWGDDDFIPRDVVDHIAAAIPGSRLVVLGNCGHFAYLEQPDATCEAITEFITSP